MTMLTYGHIVEMAKQAGCNLTDAALALVRLVEAASITNYRAQTDARLVGYIELWELQNLIKGSVARVFPTNDEPHDVAVFVHSTAEAVQVGLSEIIRDLEKGHTGMCYGDEKRGSITEYTRGFGDCLAALKRSIAPIVTGSTPEQVRALDEMVADAQQLGLYDIPNPAATVAEPVKVYPQGVMGIPPYCLSGSGSHQAHTGLTWNAAQQQAEQGTAVDDIERLCDAMLAANEKCGEGRIALSKWDIAFGCAILAQAGQRATVAEPSGWREFLVEIAQQTPEKPDYWSSCGQCERNSNRAEDLLAAALTPAAQGDEA